MHESSTKNTEKSSRCASMDDYWFANVMVGEGKVVRGSYIIISIIPTNIDNSSFKKKTKTFTTCLAT